MARYREPLHDLRCLDARRLRLPMRTYGGCDPYVMRWLVSLPLARSIDSGLVDELHLWNVGVTDELGRPDFSRVGISSQKGSCVGKHISG